MDNTHEFVQLVGIGISAVSGLYLVIRGIGNAYLLEKASRDHQGNLDRLENSVAALQKELESHLRASAQNDNEFKHAHLDLEELKKNFVAHVFESGTRNSSIIHLQEKVARIDQTIEYIMKDKKQ